MVSVMENVTFDCEDPATCPLEQAARLVHVAALRPLGA